MKEKLEILLVEDDPIACKEFVEHIDDTTTMKLIGVTNNANKALEYIKEYLPDVVILDLELHLGGGSGLNVLADLRTMPLNKSPYILITTNNTSPVTYETARELGADYIMSKHQENYSVKNALDFLQILTPSILGRRKLTVPENADTPAYNQKRILRRISAELHNVGINPKSVGYQYLIDAIEITMNQRTQNVSKIIAERYKKTEVSVIRAMQNAIERAWKSANIDDLLQYYTATINSAKGVPTITEFICFYANKLNNEY